MSARLYLIRNHSQPGHFKLGPSLDDMADGGDWDVAAEVPVNSTDGATRKLRDLLRAAGFAIADTQIGDGPTATEIFGAELRDIAGLLTRVSMR